MRYLRQPSDRKTRCPDAGYRASFEAGRIGRGTRLPPQFGQMPRSVVSAHLRQKVHSNEQIIASAAGGKSRSQHSQFGRNSSSEMADDNNETPSSKSGGASI
jgi:hypothetical protein